MSEGRGKGRPKGAKNKKTAELQAAVAASGETPLDYMTRVYRDKTIDNSRRDDMARAAAPYVHARLTAIDAKVDVGGIADRLAAADERMRRYEESRSADGSPRRGDSGKAPRKG
jgi:hypothetical protein